MSASAKFLLSSGLLLFTFALIAFFGWLRRHDVEEDDDSAEEELAKIADRRWRQKFERTPPAGLRLLSQPGAQPSKEKKGWSSKP
jgi:hypothetical protein